jgi:ATP-dependent DNA helicase PIF1
MMNQNQEYAFSLIEKGKNILITSPGGFGKTFWINEMVKRMREKYPNKIIGKTSMTGSSAILIGGTTLHSYLGIGICKDTIDMIQRIRKMKKRQVWENTDILVIDEVSMLSKEMFESLDYIAKELCQNPRPFGGIQLVLCGDFCQLGCIGSDNFCFESELWKMYIHETVLFTESYRQKDDLIFSKMLEKIRFGEITEDIENALNSRLIRYQKTGDIEPTRLYSYKKDVRDINETYLDNLITKQKKPSNVYSVRTRASKDKIKKYIPDIDQKLHLCIDAQVILTVNLDIESGLINGSRGVVKNFTMDGLPVVTFLNGITMTIDYFNYSIEERSIEVCSYSQIPLILGWAITIHKSQGMTLDLVITDLSNIFDYGQAYVTLSRVKNLNSLYITNILFSKIKCNPKVLEFYKKLITY